MLEAPRELENQSRMTHLLALFRRSSLSACVLAISLLCAFQPDAHAQQHGQRHPLLVGYFSMSSLYTSPPFFVKELADNGSAALLDQINYSAGSVRDGHCSVGDPLADVLAPYPAQNSVDGTEDDPRFGVHGYFQQLQELKRRYPRLKILISLEGRAADFAQDAKPENRATFVSSCVDVFLRGHLFPGIDAPLLFDGFDIDWESPHLQDAANFAALLKEFRRQMNALRPGLRLSVAVDQAPGSLPGTDFAALAPLVDQFAVMNYDYAGPWSRRTGLIAPLFTHTSIVDRSSSIVQSIASYKAAGVPARKLLMGLPFYGYGWTDVSPTDNGLYQTGRPLHGDHSYNSIRALADPPLVFRDHLSQAPWIYDGRNFWTYEDPVSVRYKASYADSQHLGGIMIWDLSGDTADAELLHAAHRSLHHPMKAKMFASSVPRAPEPAQQKGQ